MQKKLVKKIMKSQHTDGVRINKEFHNIFNPSSDASYVPRGRSREVNVFFNEKIFTANYLHENPEQDLQMESLRFSKELKEEFQKVAPDLQGSFSIKLGKDINDFIFEYIEDGSEPTTNLISFDTIEIGAEYDRPELARIWGYQGFQAISKGVVTPRGTNFIILFVTKEKQTSSTQYIDYIDGDSLTWEGEEKHGSDQRVVNAEKQDDQIHLFYRERHHAPFIYYGRIYLVDHKLNKSTASEFIFQIGEQRHSFNIFEDIESEKKKFSTLTETERQSLIKSRIGQGLFRKRVIDLWHSCSVTGISTISLLKASHIKPWKKCTNSERLDPYNGLLLTPNLDLLFDTGYITFDSDGLIRISGRLHERDREMLGIQGIFRLRKIIDHVDSYLKYHREMIFLR